MTAQTGPDGGGVVWIASYPKSGNTWMRMALSAALNSGRLHDLDDLVAGRSHAAARSWFERTADINLSDYTPEDVQILRARLWRDAGRRSRTPLLVKIHDQRHTPGGVDLAPPDGTRATIHLVRDPRDVAVSWAHHRGSCIEQAIADLANPEYRFGAEDGAGIQPQLPQWLGSWSGHCRSWTGGRNTLVLRYEDRLADPAGTLAQAVRFARLDASDDAVRKATEATAFDRLKSLETEAGFSERSAQSTRPFFGQGRSGGWRETLTPAQAARIERDHGEVMAEYGYL